MKARLERILLAMPVRTLRLALYGGLAIAVLLAFTATLRQPLVQYRQTQTTRASLERIVSAAPDLSAQVQAVRSDVKSLDDKLHGSLGRHSLEGQRGMALMSSIDRVAATRGVTLSGVQPAGATPAGPFVGDVYVVQAGGYYADLVGWLHDIEQGVGTLAVTEFELKSEEPGRPLAMNARLVAYRPATTGDSAPGGRP